MADRPREPQKAERLAEALRANLKRRKAQAKQRSGRAESNSGERGTAPRATGRPHDSAGIIEDK